MDSTVVQMEDKFYVQRNGICIGSSVAPILCDIFLSVVSARIRSRLQDGNVVKICRYVDDFFIVLKGAAGENFNRIIADVVSVFEDESEGLKYTFEVPENDELQFLDIRLRFLHDHICWEYLPRSKKALLPFDSAHSKLVKRGIITNCLNSALTKSCVHVMSASFHNQIARLKEAGYPSMVISSVCEALLQKIKRPERSTAAEKKTKNVHVIPYIHRVSHNIRRIASKHNVEVVFSAPCKLSKLCAMTNKDSRWQCTTKHRTRYTRCVCNVVYKIPVTCGRQYIGQTGRCFNERAKEHNLNVRNKTGSFLAEHCKQCGCAPTFENTQFLKKANGKTEREIVEAFFIREAGDSCISKPSILLTDAEIQYLKGFM